MLVCQSEVAQGHSETSNETAALKGLRVIGVLVEDIKPDVEKEGITSRFIQTDVELRLRRAGLRVLSEDEIRMSLAPFLYVNISLLKIEGSEVYAATISVNLMELVTVDRNKERIHATTWSADSTAILGKERLRRIKESVGDKLDHNSSTTGLPRIRNSNRCEYFAP